MNSRKHWDKVYETKNPNQVSWTQGIPQTSLGFIHSFELPKTAKIIDIGGGDSRLVDFLHRRSPYSISYNSKFSLLQF